MVYSYNQFLETRKTRSSYLASSRALSQYLRFIYPDCDEELDLLSLQYLRDERSFFDDLQSFVTYLSSVGNSPNTIHNRIGLITYWLKWNEILLNPSQLSILKTHMPRRVTIHDEIEITREDLVSLLNHADVLMRAILLVLASSGMRIGECLAFRLDQLQGNEIHLSYDQMKARKPHVYFISQEAVLAIEEWLKVRDVRVSRAQNRTVKCLGYDIPENDLRLFPFAYQSIASKFILLQQVSGCYEFDSVSGRSRRTLHGIRKWADSTMKLHLSVNLGNALIGHFESGDSSYRRYTRDQLREAYAKVEPYLTIMAPQEYAELKSETQQQLASHDKLLVGLMEDNYQMKQDNKVIKETLDSLVRYLESGK
ncbi:MAG TPA: site-specific integrase [Methanocorpusculum sp.]|nr:site-specific integrase [Methanocorpusculum sp.]HJK80018.1 site-specific integrase [Methanocorpusculum sp.]